MRTPSTAPPADAPRLPDYDRIAHRLAGWLRHLAPVTEAMLDRLAATPGEHVLDLACGTGEPGLSLARRSGGRVRVTGVDAAEGMVRVARAAAAAEGLSGVEFAIGPAERVGLPAAAFDAALCRFGLMLFDDPPAAAAELARLLRPGGRLVTAVWGRPEENALHHLADRVFRARLPEPLWLPTAVAARLGDPATLAGLLGGAGFAGVAVEPCRFAVRLPDPAAVWELFAGSGVFDRQLAAVPPDKLPAVRRAVEELAREYGTADGLVIPHACLLATAVRPPDPRPAALHPQETP